MERIETTISRALSQVNNDKYILSLIISKRANELLQGEKPLIEITNSEYIKETDIALRELAEGKLDSKALYEEFAQ